MVERRNTIPILSNVLIEASVDGRVRIMATDLDLQVIEAWSAVSVESAGDDLQDYLPVSIYRICLFLTARAWADKERCYLFK